MISVQQAEQIILENTVEFGTELVSIEDALGRILAESLCADRDFPPFDRVTMDGIAINSETFLTGIRVFQIEGTSAAGSVRHSLKSTNSCIEVMTGTILPEGCDTVIRYEDLLIENGIATVQIDDIKVRQNIHPKASDRRIGDVIVQIGRVISPAEIGVAATVGKNLVLVKKMPKVVIISTGDELVAINEVPLLHQIRTSNGYAIQAALKMWGINAKNVHLKDDKVLIEKNIEEFLTNFDVLILSGGVSAGKFDFVPQVLENQGAVKLFHKIAQRPGKPFWFGKNNTGQVVFALPGNPVSTFLCLQRYFKIWLDACIGLEKSSKQLAELTEEISFKPNLTYFLQVKLISEAGKIFAKPISGNGSGDLANLADADAFMELPADKEIFKNGESYPICKYR